MTRPYLTSVLVTLLLYASSLAAQAQPAYSLTPIEPPDPDIVFLQPMDINDKGEVVGRATFGAGRDAAFLWRDGVLKILPQSGPTPAGFAQATGINNRSDVVGQLSRDGFLFRHGEIDGIGAPAATINVEPTDINNRGEIIGRLRDANFDEHSFLRSVSGEFVFLEPMPGGDFTFPSEINNRGDIVGNSTSDAGLRAVIWRDGTVESLGVLPGASESSGAAINDRGQAVGVSGGRAFLWDKGQLVALPSLTAGQSTHAADINNRGRVVGGVSSGVPEEGTALLWDKGVVYELTDLISADDPLEPFVTLVDAFLINNRGQIVARGFDSRDPFPLRIYFLTPTR